MVIQAQLKMTFTFNVSWSELHHRALGAKKMKNVRGAPDVAGGVRSLCRCTMFVYSLVVPQWMTAVIH